MWCCVRLGGRCCCICFGRCLFWWRCFIVVNVVLVGVLEVCICVLFVFDILLLEFCVI